MKAVSTREILGPKDWIWMPHPGHLIVSSSCRFVLNTYVGGYIVSTVGEYWPDRDTRRIMAKTRGIEIVGRGEDWDRDYMKKIGYEEIGYERLYETMVFEATESENHCCPYEQSMGTERDCRGYNDPGDAREGHLEMCHHWSRNSFPKEYEE